MKYEQEPPAAVLIGVICLSILILFSLLGYALMQVIGFVDSFPDPTPTTYQTGLYVESEQVQQTINGRELQ